MGQLVDELLFGFAASAILHWWWASCSSRTCKIKYQYQTLKNKIGNVNDIQSVFDIKRTVKHFYNKIITKAD